MYMYVYIYIYIYIYMHVIIYIYNMYIAEARAMKILLGLQCPATRPPDDPDASVLG